MCLVLREFTWQAVQLTPGVVVEWNGRRFALRIGLPGALITVVGLPLFILIVMCVTVRTADSQPRMHQLTSAVTLAFSVFCLAYKNGALHPSYGWPHAP